MMSNAVKTPLSISMLSADKEARRNSVTKKANQSLRSTSKGKKDVLKEQRSSVTKKQPFMKTSTAQQQRKYSIFSSEGSSDSDSDSPGYVDVSRENRRQLDSAKEILKATNSLQPLKSINDTIKQRLHVDTYELDSSSDFSRRDYERIVHPQNHSNIQIDH